MQHPVIGDLIELRDWTQMVIEATSISTTAQIMKATRSKLNKIIDRYKGEDHVGA